MYDWKSQFHSLLCRLARTHGTAPLSDIQRILVGILDVQDLVFHDQQGDELPGHTPLREALERACQVSVRLQCVQSPSAFAESASELHAAGVAALPLTPVAAASLTTAPALTPPAAPASRFREGAPHADAPVLASDTRCELFLREFLRLEQRHEFMWAGYIVRELLPRLGFAPDEAKLILDRLRIENLVTISKVSNPKNPDFPATGVRLNHEHPRVKALLAQLGSARTEPPAKSEPPAHAEQTASDPVAAAPPPHSAPPA